MLTQHSTRLMPMPTKGAYSVGYLKNEHGTISAFFSALLWQHRVRFESLFQRKLCTSYVLSSKYHAGDPISILNRKHLSSYSLEISESTATLWVLCREMPPRWEGNFMVDWILWRCQMPKQPSHTTPRFDKSYEHRYLSKLSRLPSSRNERSTTRHVMIVFCCLKNVASILFWRNFQPFCVTWQKLPNLSAAFPTWQIYRIKWHHLFGSPSDPPRRAGRHGGEVVGKPSLKSIGEVCPHHRKHPGCRFKVRKQHCDFSKGRKYD